METDHLWDWTDLEEKGPPICPQSGNAHESLEMLPIQVVPVTGFVLDLAKEEIEALLAAYHGDEHDWDACDDAVSKLQRSLERKKAPKGL